MRLNVMGEHIYMTDEQYYREMSNMFNECEKIEPQSLHMELMVLEDTELELQDGYDSGWERHRPVNYENEVEKLFEIWRVNYKINHIRLRIDLQNLTFNIMEPRCDIMDTLMGNFQKVQIS